MSSISSSLPLSFPCLIDWASGDKVTSTSSLSLSLVSNGNPPLQQSESKDRLNTRQVAAVLTMIYFPILFFLFQTLTLGLFEGSPLWSKCRWRRASPVSPAPLHPPTLPWRTNLVLGSTIPPHPLSYHSCCQWNNNNNDKILEMSDTVEGGYHFVVSLVLMLELVYVRSMRHVWRHHLLLRDGVQPSLSLSLLPPTLLHPSLTQGP